MELDLYIASYFHMPAPELFLESAIGPLSCGSFVIPDFFRRREGDCPVIAGILIDNGYMY